MDDATTDDEVFRLMYRSRDLIPAEGRKVALAELFTQARSHNKAAHITGALLLRDDWFVQTLEGEEDVVRGLLARIEHDSRHDGIEVLDTTRAPRVFARWAMAWVGEPDDPDVNLIAHADGISGAAPRRAATPEQEVALKAMRSAVRS